MDEKVSEKRVRDAGSTNAKEIEGEYDVIIAGAGVAGSSAAKALADRGWKTAIFDRRVFPRHKVCGEFLSPEAKKTLQDLGLLSRVEALRPSKVAQAHITFGQGRPIKLMLPDEAFGISRLRLDAALHIAATEAGAQILDQTMVTKVERMEQGYEVHIRQGNQRSVIRARAFIAAWGGQRESITTSDHRRQAQRSYIGLKSHYTGVATASAVELIFLPDGYVGLMPVEQDLVNIAALIRRGALTGSERMPVEDKLAAIICQSPALRERLRHAEAVPASQASIYPVQLSRQPRLWSDMPYIGDAGLMIPPLCGDGMSIALYTAQACAKSTDRYLIGQLDYAGWRRMYTDDVLHAIARPLRWGRYLHHAAGTPGLLPILRTCGHLMPGLSTRILLATRLTATW